MSTLIATETFTTSYLGRTEVIRAGITLVDAGHAIAKQHPNKFAPESAAPLGLTRSLDGSANAAGAATSEGPLPTVYASPDRTKPIGIASGAMDRILTEVRDSRHHTETGGELLASRDGDLAYIISASGPGPDALRERGRCELDTEYLQGRLIDRWRSDSDLIAVGVWHSHLRARNWLDLPMDEREQSYRDERTPSETDLRAWASDFRSVERTLGFGAAAVGLILTEGTFRDFSVPEIHGWRINRDVLTKRIYCQVAEVVAV